MRFLKQILGFHKFYSCAGATSQAKNVKLCKQIETLNNLHTRVIL